MSWRIPLADLDFGPEETQAALQVLESRWLTMGAVTEQFEADFARFTGAKHAIAVTNCTVGLHMACLALDIGPGDEVIVPSLTFVATSNAVLYCGAQPVFADICGPDQLTLSPESVEQHLTSRTKAIMVMHYGGYACDMPRILEIAERHGLAVIEDAAHSVGSSLGGRALGVWGKIGCYSFFSNKNMTTGEGGMLVTDDDALAARLRLLRSHGMTSLTWDRHRGHAWSYDVVELGYNYRIDEIRSAIGIVQLQKLPAGNAARRELTTLYRAQFAAEVPELTIPFRQTPGISACHLMPVLLPPGTARVAVMDALKQEGIQTSIHYPPIHLFSYYRQRVNASSPVVLPLTEDVAARELTLPLYPALQAEQVSVVVQALRKILRG